MAKTTDEDVRQKEKDTSLNRDDSGLPKTGKTGMIRDDTRRPTGTFEGSTGSTSEDTGRTEGESDLERERMSETERNIEH